MDGRGNGNGARALVPFYGAPERFAYETKGNKRISAYDLAGNVDG